MKGLLVKDLNIMREQAKMAVLCIAVVIMVVFTGGDVSDQFSFVLMYCPMVFLIMGMSTFSYDYLDNGIEYLLTLPVTRKLYVVEKYLFSAVLMIIGMAASLLVAIGASMVKGETVNYDTMFSFAIGAAIGGFMIMGIMIPIQTKYGPEKMRTAMFGIFGVLVVIVLVGKTVWPEGKDKIAELAVKLQSVNEVVIGVCGAGIALVLIAISMLVSINIMNKKEF